MPNRSHWGPPRLSVEGECARRGKSAVVDGCARLIHGDNVDHDLIVALGGPHAEHLLAGGPRPDQEYWLRVWAARGLLWAWPGHGTDDAATDAIRIALRDPAWRVREMAAKVVARHLVGDALADVAELTDDSVPRVRAAASRAVTMLTGAAA